VRSDSDPCAVVSSNTASRQRNLRRTTELRPPARSPNL